MKTNKFKVKKLGKEYDIELEVEARNVIQDDDHQFLSKDKIKELESKPGTNDPVTSNTVTFTQAASRVNINTGETLSILFGKIKKYFADLKTVAFSGSYNDLTGLPVLGTAASKGVSNSLNVTQDGYVLDAKAGKTVNDKFGGMHFYEDASGKYVVGADSVPKKLGSVELMRIQVGDADQRGRKSFDIKTLYSEYSKLTNNNFAFSGSNAQKDGAQGQNDQIKHWISLEYNPSTGILTSIPYYRSWGPDYDRSGEGYGNGPDVSTGIVLFAAKL